MENFAVIDLGSNSVRMTITRINDDGTYSPVKEMKSYVRLSENMGEAHELQPDAIDRTLTAYVNSKTSMTSWITLKSKPSPPQLPVRP